MTPILDDVDLFTKSCNVADIYDDSTLNDIFIDGVGSAFWQSLRKYWATHTHADVTDIVLRV